MSVDILWRCALAMLAGWFLGFLSTRRALKEKYKDLDLNAEGLLKVVYDRDDPSHPAMGLEIESLSYILTHDFVVLKILRSGFPQTDKKIYLESRKDGSA